MEVDLDITELRILTEKVLDTPDCAACHDRCSESATQCGKRIVLHQLRDKLRHAQRVTITT